MPANRTSNLLEPDATTSGCYSDVTPLVSIAISLKRIADMMAISVPRNDTIEECAKACESRIRGTDGLPGGDEYGHQASYNCEDLACAMAVRALKT